MSVCIIIDTYLNLVKCMFNFVSKQATPKLTNKRKSVHSRKLRPQSVVGKFHYLLFNYSYFSFAFYCEFKMYYN